MQLPSQVKCEMLLVIQHHAVFFTQCHIMLMDLWENYITAILFSCGVYHISNRLEQHKLFGKFQGANTNELPVPPELWAFLEAKERPARCR